MEALQVEVQPYKNGQDTEAKQVSKTLFVQQSNWTAWCLIPQLMLRFHKFSELYGETDGGTLIRAFMTSFVHQRTPDMIAYIGYTDNNLVVAHLLVSLAEWYGKRTACVVQYAVDDGWYLSESQWKEIWDKVKQWAIDQKCEEITAHVAYDSNARQRAFRTFHKMMPKDVVLSMDLKKEVQSCESTDD